MAQFEPISSNLEQQMQMGFMPFGTSESLCQQMSLSDLEMGQMDSVFSQSESEQISISESQNVFFDPLLSQHGLELMPTSDQASGQVKHDSYGLGMQQHAVASKPVGGMGNVVHGVRPLQEISILSKRKVPMESSNSPALQKLSVPNKRMSQMEHRPWLQQSPSINKRTVQIHSSPTSLTSPNLPTASKKATSNKSATSVSKTQTLQMQPSPKTKQESFESVRSKMRESLAAALALVNEEKGQASDAEKNCHSKAAADERKQGDICPTESGSASDVVSGLTVGNHQEMCSSTHDVANGKANDILRVSKCGEQDSKSSNILPDANVLFSDNIFARDELLQGNGLSWALDHRMVPEEKREKPENETAGHVDKAQLNQTPEVLAFKIEEGLFKLFGGVNKKYKEKGRSLLFNLKDRSNPELRESVMSGKISPDRLCSMSAEELASKELSEWRQAKAEELAQMVVLPDTEVDIRRFVKKTHKGEFQVEFEQSDNSVEVSARVASGQPSTGAKPETEVKPKTVTKRTTQVQAASKAEAVHNKTEAAGARNKTENQGALSTVTIPSSEGADVMQGFDDEMKDSAFLPPIVSLDEFMESLDSEPPFDSLPEDAEGFTPRSGKDALEVNSESKSPVKAPEGCADGGPGNPKNDDADSDEAKSDVVPVKNGAKHRISTLKGERVWEGFVQLSVTTTIPMVAIFKSGEKTPTKEWLSSVEIKGRVRLDAFEKFLQDLRMSRSRAVMVVHLASKEEDTHKQNSLKEVADSYVSDGRVGFGEPRSGVELYFCPPHSKMLEVLTKILPKDQLDSLNAIDNGLIGVVVWRRAHIISPNSSSHYKQHTTKRQQHSSSRRQDSSFNANISSPRPSVPQPQGGGPKPQHVVNDDDDDDDCDDVPPGFGPGAASRDEDDLPEFNFSGGSKLPRHSRYPPPQGPPVAAPARPVDEVRQLIQKYGQPQPRPQPQLNSHSTHAMQPWNDDDDDIPEWQPQTAQRHVTASHGFPVPTQQPLPPAAMHIQGQLNAARPWQLQQGHYRPPPSQNGGHFYGGGQPGWR